MAPTGQTPRRGIAAAVAIATVAVLALGTATYAVGATASTSATDAAGRSATVSKRAFHDAMRQLWEEHVTWTRLFIVSFVSDVPDLQATTDRLLQNQVDIGDAVKPFYGTKAGNQLTDLLREHILTAADLLAAAKSGDTAAFDQAKSDWYANARQIARFLHDANPDNWPLADLRSMMKMHLDLTLQEASDQLGGDYAAAVADYDAVEAEILEMADTLSSGIVAQFPRRFR
ncbi:MAG: hypothetical protein ACE14W_11805 [Candidatus Velamenicoccus archaeovorus]